MASPGCSAYRCAHQSWVSALIRKVLPLREDALEQQVQETQERSYLRW
ncbi:hypothetical protein P0082_03675 [Candidatus Haliotispira prima]|uniref:Uncharacterized protein n=1 Tax=Candidatus Haliotispira prima TaxID=3034016 RepID=A0ABY8MLB0_9SPIO|nr:hypothetical protein P0082_03675 [Candidatus Haliotispira prima]